MKFQISLLIILFHLTSCSSKPAPEDKKDQLTPQRKIVGRIASVSSTGNFVLIQKYGPGSLPLGKIFQSEGTGGRQASLKVSGERIRDFFAADLLRGNPEIGDLVFSELKQSAELSTEQEGQSIDDLPLELQNAPPSEIDTEGVDNAQN